MNDPLFNRFRELCWKGKLPPAGEAELRAWLKAHPEARAEWEAEAGLNDALARLPDVPVATNFTARVLQTVTLESSAGDGARTTKSHRLHGWLRWLPRAALAGVVLCASLLSYEQLQAQRREKLAQSVAVVSDVSSLPSPEILKDFEAIQALNRTPPADEELLALLQ
jgi:anti-sigma factor RsiW